MLAHSPFKLKRKLIDQLGVAVRFPHLLILNSKSMKNLLPLIHRGRLRLLFKLFVIMKLSHLLFILLGILQAVRADIHGRI